jgi:hypothetical protein
MPGPSPYLLPGGGTASPSQRDKLAHHASINLHTARNTIAFEAVDRQDLQGLKKRGARRRVRKGRAGMTKDGHRQHQPAEGGIAMLTQPVLSSASATSRRDKAVARRRRRHMEVEVSRLPKLALSDLSRSVTLSLSSSSARSGGRGPAAAAAAAGAAAAASIGGSGVRGGRAQSVDSAMLSSPTSPTSATTTGPSGQQQHQQQQQPAQGAYRFLGHSIPLIEATLRKAGLRATAGEDWNVMWSAVHPRPQDFSKLVAPSSNGSGTGDDSDAAYGSSRQATSLNARRLNVFPRSFELTRKDALSRNVNRMREVFSHRDFDFMPESYCLPAEREMLRKATCRDRDAGRTRVSSWCK